MNSCVTHLTFIFFLLFWGELLIERDLDSGLAQILGISQAVFCNKTTKSR